MTYIINFAVYFLKSLSMILKYLKVACFLLMAGFAGAQVPIAFTFNSTSGDPTPGGVYDVEVRVSDFDNIESAQFAIFWDSAVLEIDTVPFLSPDLPDLNQGVFTLPEETQTPVKGRLRVSWLSFSLTPQSLPDDTHLFTMRFNVTGMPCDTTSFRIDGIPPFVPIEVTQQGSSGNIGAVGSQDVMIPGVGCEIDPPPPGDCPDGDIVLTFNDLEVNTGDQVCIPMTMDNVTDVITFQGSLMWDPSVLSITSTQNYAFPGMSPNSFGIDTLGGVSTFLWFDQTGGGNAQTFPDGTPAFELCFDVIGDAGSKSTLKAFSGNPTQGEAIIQISTTTGVADVCTEEGCVTVDGISEQEFRLIGEKVTVSASETMVCVDVSVENFDDIVGMQFTMQWDPTILAYKEVDNLNGGLEIFDIFFNPIGNDRLRFSWAANPPRTVPDGTILFSVCFDVLPGNEGETSPFNFIDDGQFSPIEISEVGDVVIDYELSQGCVTIDDVGRPRIENVDVNHITCNGDDDGVITARVSGTGLLTCEWELNGIIEAVDNNVTSGNECEATGLMPGDYVLIVTDNTGNSTTQGVMVSEPDPIVITTTMTPRPITDAQSGRIFYQVSGGTGTLREQWTGNIDPDNITDPPNQNNDFITLIVTDDNGCMTDMTWEVPDNRTPVGPDIRVDWEITDASCDDDGMICIVCSGGSGTFVRPTISPDEGDWDPVGGCYVNLPPGPYTITCTDSNGDTATRNTAVDRDARSVRINVENIIDATCEDGGSFDVVITGGCEPFEITIGDPDGNEPKTTYDENFPYPAGDYDICVTDKNGDSDTFRFRIGTNNDDIIITDAIITDAPCTGMNGFVELVTENQCGEIKCRIDIGNQGTTVECTFDGDLIVAPVGRHTITITDCETNTTASREVVVDVSDDAFNVVVVNMGNCFVDVEASGGTPPYSFMWTSLNGFESMDQNLSDLADAGPYRLSASDSEGCTVVLEVDVMCMRDDTTFEVRVDNSGIESSLCAQANDDCSGSIPVTIVGGVPPYMIALTDQNGVTTDYDISTSGSAVLDNLCPGSYVLDAVDSEGTPFQLMETVIIEGPDAIVIEEDDIQCADPDESNGSIAAFVDGGAGGLSYTWTPDDPSFTGPTIEDIPAGNYLLTVMDSNDCEEEFLFTVETCGEPPTGCNEGISVITPNSDGINDHFTISCAETMDNTLAIYDRWSRPVFKGTNYTNNWNGTDMDGQPLIEGAYYWVYEVGGQLYKGTVTLLRD